MAELKIVEEIYSSPTTITLDRRRAEQIVLLAQGQGKTIASWIEEVVSREWDIIYPGQPIPSLKLSSRYYSDNKVSVAIAFEPLSPDAAVVATPESATEFGHILFGAANGNGVVSSTIECDDGQSVTISRKGNGVVIQIDNLGKEGEIFRYILGMTPSLASDYADRIFKHSQKIKNIQDSLTATGK
jgi:hypothetical protein